MLLLRLSRHIFALIITASYVGASLVLNEVAYSGGGDACDGEDWVELHNSGTDAVSLEGYVLHDDKGPGDDDAKTFNGPVLDAGEYMVLCRGPDFAFGIGKSDSITLLDGGGRTASTTGIMPGTRGDGATYALFGGTFSYTLVPTPGALNILSVPRVRPLEEILEEQNEMGLDFFRLNDDGSLRPSSEFGVVVDLFIHLDEADHTYLVENPAYEQYVPFDSIRVESNGSDMAVSNISGRIRTKGQSSLILPVCIGLMNTPFQIKFGEKGADGTFFGMKVVYLRNHVADQSYMREHALHRLNARFGLPFLRTRHVRLYLNGNYVGLYTMMEAPTQDYVMQRSFGPYDPTKTGLFKFKTQAAICKKVIEDHEVEIGEVKPEPEVYYFERGEHRDKIPVDYRNKTACYGFLNEQLIKDRADIVSAYITYGKDCAKASVEVGMVDLDFGPKSLKPAMEIFLRENIFRTNVSLPETVYAENFSLPEAVDADQWLKNFASYAVTINLDSPLISLNNWYIATTDGGNADWRIVQYDMNGALTAHGRDKCSLPCGTRMVYWPLLRPTCGAVEDHPLLGPLFAVTGNIEKYVAYVEEFMGLLDDQFFLELRDLSGAIKDFVLEDPLNKYTAKEFDKYEMSPGYDEYLTYMFPFPFVKTLMARREQVAAQLTAIRAGTLPRNGVYGKEEACPDWRDSKGEDYINSATFVPGPKCPATCKTIEWCFEPGKGCTITGEASTSFCQINQEACKECFPYSLCGTLEDESTTYDTSVCDGESWLPCKKNASHCFSHLLGECTFDGQLIGVGCKGMAICGWCFPKSRCAWNKHAALPSFLPTHIPSFLPSSSQSQSLSLSPTTFPTSTPTTSSPTISSPTTSAISVPTISAPTTLPSSLTTNTFCVDQPGHFTLITNNSTTTCAEIQHLENKQDREGMCTAATTSSEEMINRCPLACGNNRCYSPVQSCWKTDVHEAFKVAGSRRTCMSISRLRTSTERSKNELHGQLCLSHARHLPRHGNEAINASGIYNHGLVQDICPMACQHLECTCADKTFPFVTVPLYNSTSGRKMEERTERSCASLLQNRSPHGMSMWEYINMVCLLGVHAAHHAMKVHHMCPAVCGFRKECFCRDSRKPVPTPGLRKNSRYCWVARFSRRGVKNVLCDRSKQAAFSRSCPITCGDPTCQGESAADSIDTLSFDHGRVVTSCWIISKGNAKHKGRYCNAVEVDFKVEGKVLCPNACKDYVN